MSQGQRSLPAGSSLALPTIDAAAASLVSAAASLLVEARLRGEALDEAQALERAIALYQRARALLGLLDDPALAPAASSGQQGPLLALPTQSAQPIASPASPAPSLSHTPQPPAVAPASPSGPPPLPAASRPTHSGSIAGDLHLLLQRDPASLIGRSIAGRYRLVRLEGDSGQSVRYSAMVERTGQDVTLRVIRGGQIALRTPQRWAKVQQQVRDAQRLAHGAFIRPDEVGESSGLVYVVSEAVQGQTLATLLVEQSPLSVQQSLDVAWRAGEAMRAAHEQGVLHGAIEPERIMAQPDAAAPGGYRVRLLDIGLAELLSPGLPGSGSVAGLPWYLAPEQLMGGELDERSDVYSLGAVLFHCLAGAPPFADSESLGQFMASKTGEQPRAPSALRAGIPPHVDWAVLHALSPSREKRTASMGAFLQSIAPPRR